MRHRWILAALLVVGLQGCAGLCPCEPGGPPTVPGESTPTPGPIEAPTPEPGWQDVKSLELIRPWPAGEVPSRVRVFGLPGGGVGLLRTRSQGKWITSVLEDEQGNLIEKAESSVEIAPRLQPVTVCGRAILVRDGQVLRLGGEAVGNGSFETYTGVCTPEGDAIVAWMPCTAGRQCWATVFHREPGLPWAKTELRLELFGAEAQDLGDGRVVLATRENPANKGWRSRVLALAALARQGAFVETPEAGGSWVPESADLSLEDPLLVPGAKTPTLIGGGYSRALKGPDGQVYVARAGERLKTLPLTVARVRANDMLSGAVLGGKLYVAAETDDGLSELVRLSGGSAEVVAEVRGGAPFVGMAGGQLYVTTAAGLWVGR